MAETAELAVKLNLQGVSSYTSGMARVERANAGLSRSAGNIGKTLGKIGGEASRGLGNAVKNLERMAVVAGGLTIGAAGAAVKWAGDFEASLNTINTVAMVTPQALSAIGDGIRKIAKDTGLSLDDLTSGYYDLVSAGIKAKDAQAILNDAVTLGIGGLATTAESIDLLTTAVNAYGLDAAGAAKATDAFAQAVADGKVKASEIAATFADIAPLAKNSGISINEIAAAFAFLTAKGVAAAEVTTQMKRALIELLKPNADLIALQKKVGENFAATARAKGLNVALNDLVKAAKANNIPLTDLFSRVEGLQYVLQTTGPNAGAFSAELDKIGKSAGEAAKQMAERQQGLNFQMAKLAANVKDAGITIGSALIPELVTLSADLTTFLQGHQPDIKAFGQNLAKAFKDAVTWAKSLDWKAIGDGLKVAAGAAKGVMDAFMAAPTWLKEAVITGWGLNKLTGGALTGIGGDILKGLGDRFLSRGSSPVNPLFVQQVGLPGGVGPAAGAGLLGKAAAVVQGVFIVGLAAEAADLLQHALGGTLEDRTNAGTTVPGDQLQWPFGPKNTPHFDLGPLKNILGGDSTFAPPSDFTGGGSHSEDRKIELASIDAIRANTVALRVNAKDIEKAWLKTIDPKDIGARSKAKSGHDATPAQIAAIRTRDELHQLKVITEKSKASSDVKLERLRVLAADAKAHGDTKTATKVDKAIATMKAKIATEQAKTTGQVEASGTAIVGAVQANNSDINVYVTTTVTASDIATTTVTKDRMGPGPGSSNGHLPGAGP